jgi:beta-glucosidase
LLIANIPYISSPKLNPNPTPIKNEDPKTLLAGCLLLSLCAGCRQEKKSEPTNALNPQDLRKTERTDNAEVEGKIDDLLSQMTLDEKIGQMTQLNNSVIATNADWAAGSDLKIEISLDTGKLGQILREYHVGSFLNGIAVPTETWYTFYKEIQHCNMKNSRVKIPVIYGVDHMHGPNYLEGGTVFPHAINISSILQ